MVETATFDWAKIGMMATGAAVMGVVMGSRDGGTFIFEIGPNLLTLSISVIPLSMLSMAVNNYLKMRAMSGQLLSQKSEK